MVTTMATVVSENSTYPSPTDVLMNPYIEIPFLIIVILIGTVGNLFIIGATLVEKQLRNMGVAFIINLAVADLIVTAWFLPVVLANIFYGYKNAFESVPGLCYTTGFLSSFCCEASMLTLMFIALNRCCKVTKPELHEKWFKSRYTIFIIVFIWIECFLVALPLIVGWFGLGEPYIPSMIRFDKQMMSCMWNDDIAPGYNIFLVCVAIFAPIIATTYFYTLLFLHTKRTKIPRREIAPASGKDVRRCANSAGSIPELSHGEKTCAASPGAPGNVRTHHVRHNSINTHKNARSRRAEEKERNLVLALVTVVVFFVLFWTPYALMTLTNNPNDLAKRACGWLALSNSAINSIIYGVLNRHFRRGYVKLCKKFVSVFCCCCPDRVIDALTKNSAISGKTTLKASDEYKQYNVKFG